MRKLPRKRVVIEEALCKSVCEWDGNNQAGRAKRFKYMRRDVSRLTLDVRSEIWRRARYGGVIGSNGAIEGGDKFENTNGR